MEKISSEEILEKEIETLSQKLEEKKSLLAKEQKFLPQEKKEIVTKEVIREHLEKTPIIPISSRKKISITPQILPSGKISLKDLKKFPKEKQLEILISLALFHSLSQAVSLAKQLADPFLLDEFHDLLVDRFYQELVKRNKI